MKRQPYYPKNLSLQPEWHANLAAKLVIHGPVAGLSAAQVNNGVADNLMLGYGLGNWLTNVREFGPACTANLKILVSGSGGDPFVFATYAAPAPPALPAGADPVLPGALDRVFKLVQEIKAKPAYTEAMGLDMGIVGPEAATPPPGDAPPPRIKLSVIQGQGHEDVVVKFVKDGHDAIWLESRRGNGGWEHLGVPSRSPFTDSRPLLASGQAEVREFRARFYDDNQPNGGWCDVAKITVSP